VLCVVWYAVCELCVYVCCMCNVLFVDCRLIIKFVLLLLVQFYVLRRVVLLCVNDVVGVDC